MKTKGSKLISLIILLAMIFTTFGCDSSPDATTPYSTPEATAPAGSGDLQGGTGKQIRIYDIEDYNEYLQTHKEIIPDGFLTADMLKELGTFYSYIDGDILTDASCYYFFIHEDKYLLGFESNSFHSTMPIIDTSLLGPTMATLTEKIRGKIWINGFEYMYKEGRLLYITWDTNDRIFCLSLTQMSLEQLEEMPTTLSEDSILRKLLSKDAEDQIAAYNQLVDMVTK